MSSDRPTPAPSSGDRLFFKPAAVTVLAAGMFLHATRILGGDSALETILTPTVDGIFGLVMAYAAGAGWFSWRKIAHPRRLHRAIHGAILVYLTISVPVHVRSFFTDDVGDLTGVFPVWYSGVFLVVVTAMVVHIWRLRFVPSAGMPAAHRRQQPSRQAVR